MIPPLRERREDVPLLLELFRHRYADRFETPRVRFTAALVAALSARDWPGNVRELENAVARLLAFAEADTVDVDALSRLEGGPAVSATTGSLRDQVATFERTLLAQALAECGGNQSEAARRLGVSRMTLIDKLKRYGLP